MPTPAFAVLKPGYACYARWRRDWTVIGIVRAALAAAVLGHARALAAQPCDEVFLAHRPARVFGRSVCDRCSGRQRRACQIAVELTPAVALVVAVLDVRHRAVAALEFDFKISALFGVKLAGRAVGVDVDVRVGLHGLWVAEVVGHGE
jgi:hypothetical protein